MFSPTLYAIAFTALILATPSAARAVRAYEPPPPGWVADTYRFSGHFDYFTSKANYEQDRGGYHRLIGDSNIAIMDTKLRARYAVSNKVSIFTGIGYANVKAIDPLKEKTNSQLTDLNAGVSYSVLTKWMRLVPELQAGLPLDASSATQDKPMTSDGVFYGRIGVFGFKPMKYLRLQGYAGFHWPSVLSKRFLYEITGEVPLGSKFLVGGGMNGHETWLGDGEAETLRRSAALRANAGSFRYYSYNPSLTELRAWAGWIVDRQFIVRAGLAKTINGIRSAEGQSFLISAIFGTSAPTVNESRAPKRRDLIIDENEAKSFEADVEKVDQGLFEIEQGRKSTGEGNLDDTEQMLENRGR
jgi:hypothetical protein